LCPGKYPRYSTQIRFIVPAWLGTLEALKLAEKGQNNKILKDMLNNWPFFYAMMDMLDMVLTKTDQRVIQFYEECLADQELKNIGEKLRKQLLALIYLNKKLIDFSTIVKYFIIIKTNSKTVPPF
jgi:phosphoenolpyruvate carboxylase